MVDKGYKRLDDERQRLNHDKVKNAFLNKIGSARQDIDIDERSNHMKIVWLSLRGEASSVADLESIKKAVYQGLHNWSNVLSELRNFFDKTVRKCGYKGTALFEDARKQIFEGDQSVVMTIDFFVKEFDKIALLSEEERERRLVALWSAADKIQIVLSKMRLGMDADAHFGEYFEKA